MPNRARALLTVAAVLAVSAGRPAAVGGGQEFRSGVDLIPVDVQVVDRDGQPVEGLGGDQFEVTIEGDRRRVVSVDFVDHRRASDPSGTITAVTVAPGAASAAGSAASSVAPETLPPRVIVLAVDAASLEPSTARPVLDAAITFVEQLPPGTEIGLLAYPIGPRVNPTTDREAVLTGLRDTVAQRDIVPLGQFNLSPSDVVELSTMLPGANPTPAAEALLASLCPPADEDTDGCQVRLEGEVLGQVLLAESQLQTSMGMIAGLMQDLAAVPIRKTLVFVSGGIVSADVPFARPDTRELGFQVGRAAAEANVSVYTLFVNSPTSTQFSAQMRRTPTISDPGRDRRVNSLWLERFSDSAGGSMLNVAFDNGGMAFERVLSETSTYYLLGVEPDDEDRDGRPHRLEVKVSDRSYDVRSRSWVVVPRPGETASAARVAAAAAPRVISPEIRALAEAFDQDDRAGLVRLLSAPSAPNVVRDLRENGGPWENDPRRQAAFALEVAITGLRLSSNFTRQAALELLANASVRVRQPSLDDPFECAWLQAESAGLAGLFGLPAAAILVQRAVDRCPSDPRLHLALAVVHDQQLLLQEGRVPVADEVPNGETRAEALPPPITEVEQRVLELYEAAAAFPAAHDEARVRAASVLLRSGHPEDGLAQLDALPDLVTDPFVRYYAMLFRGQLLRALERWEEADRAYRDAMAAWPGAQAPRVALMTLLVKQGAVDEAIELAELIQSAGPNDADPWWVYWLGDYRSYPQLRAEVRGALP